MYIESQQLMSRYLKNASRLFAVFFLLGAIAATAQQNPKRLILKDGSYQTATKWEITGGRVRYFSAERYTWEEMPKDLVDWPATDKYNQEHEKQRTISASEVVQQDEADRRAEEAANPTVAPGLRLPDGGGVFLLDVFHNQAQLIELAQNGGEVNKHTGKNILRAALNPLALSSRQTIEIKGEHAPVQAHQPQPAIYVNVESSNESSTPTEDSGDHYRLVRLEQRKDSRVVGNLSVAVYGKVSQKENWIPATNTPLGSWIKVTPAEPLQPGEYALVEMLDKKQINIYVWDFGVNPDAPPNAKSWVAKPPALTPSGKTDDPALGKRPPQ
jgi:hypothetical protein